MRRNALRPLRRWPRRRRLAFSLRRPAPRRRRLAPRRTERPRRAVDRERDLRRATERAPRRALRRVRRTERRRGEAALARRRRRRGEPARALRVLRRLRQPLRAARECPAASPGHAFLRSLRRRLRGAADLVLRLRRVTLRLGAAAVILRRRRRRRGAAEARDADVRRRRRAGLLRTAVLRRRPTFRFKRRIDFLPLAFLELRFFLNFTVYRDAERVDPGRRRRRGRRPLRASRDRAPARSALRELPGLRMAPPRLRRCLARRIFSTNARF